MNDLDFKKRDLLVEVERCEKLFNSKVFTKQQIFTQSAFIEILVRLNYILQELDKKNNRIIWTNNVQTDQNIKDITDLINHLRNAACHIDSQRNFIENTNIKFVFNIFIGKCTNMFKFGDISLGNNFSDDVAFYYGNKRIYLIRHIKKLLETLPDEINKLK